MNNVSTPAWALIWRVNQINKVELPISSHTVRRAVRALETIVEHMETVTR